ncbi:MAG: RimK family protein [Pseudomonas sp.]
MSKLVIIVERKEDWTSYYPSEDMISAQEYLEQPIEDDNAKRVQVINLCRHYKYLGHGYYCSLLAEARGHKVIPSVRTISELARKALYGLALEDLDKTLDKALADHPFGSTDGFTLTLYFGRTDIEPLQDLARQLFEAFPCPLLLVEFRCNERWHITGIKPGALHRLREDQEDLFASALDNFSRKIWRKPRSRRLVRFDLAVLHNPEETFPPSNAKALKNFIRVGKRLGIEVDLIEKKDYSRLAEYDALFIRETTSVSDHTYRFAKKAESEGLVVLDDPASILRCTNKVYLADLLKAHKLGMPATEILYKERPQDLERVGARLGFPLVLKIPDGSFSRGVIKVADHEALLKASAELFEHSVLLLAQEFFYTEYDWRIGVLNRQPIFACQYFMSKGHWQIYDHSPDAEEACGESRTLAVEAAPPEVVALAVKIANLIGDGLYGVDLKQAKGKVVVIEVNDNPNIDAGVEDAYLQDELYALVLLEFVRRLELKRRGQPWSENQTALAL